LDGGEESRVCVCYDFGGRLDKRDASTSVHNLICAEMQIQDLVLIIALFLLKWDVTDLSIYIHPCVYVPIITYHVLMFFEASFS